MRARAGIVMALVTVGGVACPPAADRGVVDAEPPGSSPVAAVAPDVPATRSANRYGAELAEAAELAKWVDAYCACPDRSCGRRAKARIHDLTVALGERLPDPPPAPVATAVRRATEPLAQCESRRFPPVDAPLPAPARRLAKVSTCRLQATREGVFFTTREGALKRATFGGKVMEVLPPGIIKAAWNVDKDFVYYDVADEIRRIPLHGGRAQKLHKGRWPDLTLAQFTVDRTHVYWEDGPLQRKAKAGGAVADVANVHGPLLQLTVADGFVYYSNGAALAKAAVTGGEPKLLLASSSDTPAPEPSGDRPRLDLPFVERGAYLYGRTEQCGVFRVPKAGGAARILTQGPSPRDRYFGCEKGAHLAVGRTVRFEVATPDDEVLLEVPLAGGEPKELLSAGRTTICAMVPAGSKTLVANEHGIFELGG